MKLFQLNFIFKYHKTIFILLLSALVLNSCAVKQPMYGDNITNPLKEKSKNAVVNHTFYLIGDAGNADQNKKEELISFFKAKLKLADKNSTLLFLGDNIYPSGMPDLNDPSRKSAEGKLNLQLSLTDEFKGKTIFVPGNHDWYSDGIVGLKREEEYINAALKSKNSFLPKNGCPIDEVTISDNLVLITIDSQWYLENWNKNPNINQYCKIKSREEFFTELEDQLNINQQKTVIIALHHPLMTSGSHGGQFSLEKQLFPLENKIPIPILGSLSHLIRKTGGVSPQDLQNKMYTEYSNRIKTLLTRYDNVVVVSGHDHNLQYLEKDNIKQIISGSGSKIEAARAINKNDFSAGYNGYAVLKIAENGAVFVTFYGVINNKEIPVFSHKIRAEKEVKESGYPRIFDKKITTSIYSDEMTRKSTFYKLLWGNHYRAYYSTKIEANVSLLDTLNGGLKPVTSGNRDLSKSLFLVNKSGKEFVMRSLKKSATRFIQSVAFKDQFIENDFKNTYTENFLQDFYTSSHPYTPFVVPNLAAAIDVYHTNPKLFYVPKQNALQIFNADFGDELYLIEERPMDGFVKQKSFGSPDAIVTTATVLSNLNEDSKYEVDEDSYIRARLFDMLIGDWDRNADQWSWSEFHKDGKIIYKPIPQHRDKAFSKYDGIALHFGMNSPDLRHMQSFKKNIKNIQWFNKEPYPLDIKFLKTATAEMWLNEANYIQENLTDDKIDAAFKNMPIEVQDVSTERIKKILKIRRDKLNKYAKEYFAVLQNTAVIVGTNKKDKFSIKRLPDNKTEITVFTADKDGDKLQYKKVFDKKTTKQIWIYGLRSDDEFELNGNQKSVIRLKLIGGSDTDIYKVENGKRVTIYDYATKNNTFNIDSHTKKILSDKYELNTYDYQKPKFNSFSGSPSVGFNPDDGLKVGFAATYTVNSFIRNPFSQKHDLKANYYFATNGYEFNYNGIFPNNINNWHVELDAIITSPNFSSNFFGFGNETRNDDKELTLNYNRVKIQTLGIAPSIHWKGPSGAAFFAKVNFKSVQVDPTAERFIVLNALIDPEVFQAQTYLAAQVRYSFENYDNKSNPSMGMKFYVEGGYEVNFNKTFSRVPYVETALGFTHKLVKSNQFVFAALVKSKMLFSNDYRFYQMATIGGDHDIRAFRFERFSGKSSFFITTDLRYEIGKFENIFIPAKYGLFAGFDSGRVWIDNDFSNQWHNSFGGGVWINAVKVITGKLSYFHGSDGGRLAIGIGLGF